MLFGLPLFATVYQMKLMGNPEMLSRFNKVRAFKWFTFASAVVVGAFEKWEVEKRFKYLDRIYNEPTAL